MPTDENPNPQERAERARKPEFWEALYQAEDTGWDLGGPSPVLDAAVGLGLLGRPGRVIVPGAGRGHDALRLAAAGFSVTAVDFSASAVQHMRQAAKARGLGIDVLQEDLLALTRLPAGHFDAAFEYTCFVAIDPALRPDYVRVLTHLVRPGGRLLFLAFPLGRTEPGPPHGLTLDELRTRFSGDWRWVLDTAPPLSPEPRRPAERLVLLERCGVQTQ